MGGYIYRDALSGSTIELDGYTYALTDEVEHTHNPYALATLFFPGCSLINHSQMLIDSVYDTLLEMDPECGISLLCCGKILAFEPEADTIRPAFEEQLVGSLLDRGVERVVAACPNCVVALRGMLERFGQGEHVEVVALPFVLAEQGLCVRSEVTCELLGSGIVAGQGANPHFAVHDSCPDRELGEFAAGVRALFAPDMLEEMVHNRKKSFCCGSLLRAAGNAEAADAMARRHGEEGLAAGVDAMVSACVSCAHQLSFAQNDLPIFHYLELLYGTRVQWRALSPYLHLRFLFDPLEGKRGFAGLNGSDSTCPETQDGGEVEIKGDREAKAESPTDTESRVDTETVTQSGVRSSFACGMAGGLCSGKA